MVGTKHSRKHSKQHGGSMKIYTLRRIGDGDDDDYDYQKGGARYGSRPGSRSQKGGKRINKTASKGGKSRRRSRH
jgi:hypothetical protein